jgi:hypothetical protein
MTNSTRETAVKIAALNDLLPKGMIGGSVYFTQGVRALGDAFVSEALKAVRDFSDFSPENDPYVEHDFGAVAVPGRRTNLRLSQCGIYCLTLIEK